MPEAADRDAGHGAQQIGHMHDLAALDLLSLDYRDAAGHLGPSQRYPGGTDDNRLQLGRLLCSGHDGTA